MSGVFSSSTAVDDAGSGFVADSDPEKSPDTFCTSAGHDENVSFEAIAAAIGDDLAALLRQRSIEVYQRGAKHAAAYGIVLADTKLEWGRLADGSLLLVDEVLTPASSRFWPATAAGQGRVPDSFDKQFVRDWLEHSGWDKASPPPELPAEISPRPARNISKPAAC